MIHKWGCDGSAGHSNYKQKFSDESANDEYLFTFSFVPIKLHPINLREVIGWQNLTPSSTRFCRPISFIFQKETAALVRAETDRILTAISALKPTLVSVGSHTIEIKHEFLCTMVDGKICNTMTDTTSAQKCYICGATPKTMNIPQDVSEETLFMKTLALVCPRCTCG